MESQEDLRGPPVAKPEVRGGTRVLADQAACPFRAFARFRLNAEALEEPAPGLDARDRGKLLHALMKFLWTELKTSESLKKDLEPAITRAADAAVKELELEGRFAELERARLARLAREWIDKVEAKRQPFEVALLEEKRSLKVAGLEFSGRIDRMDRLKEGELKGAHVLIDYKSGNPTLKGWDLPRPEDPQLLLYALAEPERLAAVVFAKLKPGEMRFMGHAKGENILPKVAKAQSWTRLLSDWKRETESLGAAFAAGDARVDPKHDLATCRLCDLQTLCRVYEKYSALEGEGE